jgi:ABC-2 type transport system permease protein
VKKTVLVMLNEISATLRRKMFVIFAFVIPLVLGVVALVVMAVNRNAAPVTSIDTAKIAVSGQTSEGYVDHGSLIEKLPADIPAGWLTEYATEAAARAALEAKEISAYYVIPADYVRTGEITYIRPEHNPISDRLHTDGMEWILLFNLLDGDAELAANVRKPFDVQVTQLASADSAEEAESWISSFFPNLMALVLYMVILMPAGGLVNAMTDEKKNRVTEVLVSSVSPQQLVTGKILALGLLGLLQTALWVGVMWAVVRFGGQTLNIPPGFVVPTELLVWMFVYFLLGYTMYGTQMAGVGVLAPDIKDARGVTFVVMAPLIVVYMFLVGIILAPDGPVALVLSLFPLTSPVGMIARMTVTKVPPWQPLLAAVLQLLTAILIVRLVARLFRAQMLLSGQPSSVKRFFAALLGRA